MSSDEARPEPPDQAVPAPDRVYDADQLWPDYAIGQMSRYCAVLHGSLGYSAHRSNLYLLRSPDIVVYIAGHQLVFLSLESGQRSYLSSHDAAIGAIAIHPSNNLIAVAEGNVIVVYSWPKLDPVRILKQGSERGYADLTFNSIGDQLASVGTEPDYQLIIWNWDQEKILLRTKAFSQDICRVRFSPRYAGRLVTCGTGHIRFWTMARTFTGMKLQGHIGKFGAIDLSDIAAFAELPDGKVICGTESGDLLVWEDALIAYTIVQSDGKSCHDGMIEHIEVTQNGTQLVTAGRDGKIKRWNVEELSFVDVPDHDRYYRMMPINVYTLPDVSIVTLVEVDPNRCLVQNSNGSILSVQLADPPQVTPLLQFHSGSISAVLTCSNSYEAITLGNDRTVRLWDLISLKCISQQQYPSAITSAIWATSRIAVAGFSDGTVRCLDISSGSIQLAFVSKPHRKPVRCLASSMSYLATASPDQTVFLFQISSQGKFALNPIGFFNVTGAIQSMDFDPVHDDSLIIAAGQQLHRFKCPKSDSVDTTASFEIPADLTSVSIDLRSIISAKNLRQNRARAESQAGASENTNEAAPAPNASASTSDEQYVQPDIRCVKFSRDGSSVYVAFDGDDYGPMIINCEPNTLSLSSYHELLSNGVVCEIQHGVESDLIVSVSDGSVELRRSDAAIRIIGHDRGRVHQNLSFDGRLLVTCGSDGNLHVYRVNIDRGWEYYRLNVPDQEIQLDSVDDIVGALPEPQQPSQQALEYSCQDITDPTMYSLQEAKLKQEADNEQAAAESRKNRIRAQIQQMRQEFVEIQNQCESLGIPLPVDVDPTLIPRLQAQAAADIEQLRREQAWHIERRIVALNKLKRRYLDQLLVERIELRSIRRPTSVTSFRTVEFPAALKKDINAVREIIMAAQRNDEKRNHDLLRKTTIDAVISLPTKAAQRSSAMPVQNLPKSDARKQERLARGMRRAELERLKPSANEARPEDIEAIKYAEENMGDYKLKSADSYVVPVQLRVNAVQKRRQMLLIQESMQKIKLEFNQRFLALRDLKRRLLDSISRDSKRVVELNQILNDVDDEENYEIEQDPDEWPENRDNVTMSDLKQYKRTLKERLLAQETAKKSNAYGGGATVASEAAPATDSDEDDGNAEPSIIKQASRIVTKISDNEKLHADLLKSLPKSALEKRRRDAELRLWRHERDTLRDKIRSTITAFDDAVEELRQEKFRLEADLKQTEIKMLILFQELQLLKSFDDREAKLTASLEKNRAEKAQIVLDLTECQAKIADKLKEITEWQEKDQRLSAEFRSVVGGDKHPAYAALLKIYKRKIKRTKKKSESSLNDGDNDDHGSVEASDDDSDDDFMNDSNSDSDEDDDDACPANCDNVTYERVLELRERRLDHEDELVVFNRAVDDLKQMNDRLMAREKAIDRDLRTNDAETEAFQSEKQRALNQIDVTVPLRISQFQYLTGDPPAPPESLNHALIFTQTALNRLQERIKVLQTEKITLRRDQNDLRQQHKTLTRELRSMSAAIDVERKRCEEVQMLKFGRLVDIDKLESAASNSAANEMAAQLDKLQKQWTKKLTGLEQKISEADKELSLVTGENTKLLHMVAELTSRQFELDHQLNAASESPHLADSTGPSARHDVEERIRLVKLVQAQADEIEHLKAELSMLRRKGGYLYGPGPELHNRQKQMEAESPEGHDNTLQGEESILPPI